MATNSSEAGYLAPIPPAPPYDQELEDIFQAALQGLTGLPGNMIRPRFQAKPPNQPGFDVDWAAFSVFVADRQWNAYQHFEPEPEPDGAYVTEGNEVLHLSVSFYGPHCDAMRHRFEAALQLGQNLDGLGAYKIKYKQVFDPVILPALLKEQWVKRIDVKAVFHRWCRRVWPVLTYRSATVDLHNERYIEHISVTPPPSP